MRYFESIISTLAMCEISIFYLVSVAEETGLSLALSESPKTISFIRKFDNNKMTPVWFIIPS